MTNGNLVASGSISISDINQRWSGLPNYCYILRKATSAHLTLACQRHIHLQRRQQGNGIFRCRTNQSWYFHHHLSWWHHTTSSVLIFMAPIKLKDWQWPTVSVDVTEGSNVTNGNLVASGSISILDVNQGEAAFQTTVTSTQGNLGSLVLNSNGTYTYRRC